MANKEAPLTMLDVPSPKMDINVTGVGSDPTITGEYQKYLDSLKELSGSLEQRYAQPNWFKIAAGFAKPQLGGFLASLGSASQAMGEQIEQQRAVAPTIAQMRSEIAKGTLGLTQAQKAAQIAAGARAAGRLPTGVEAAEMAGLTAGPSAEAPKGQEIQTAQIADFIRALQAPTEYAQMVAKYGKTFVDQMLPSVLSLPGIKAPAGWPGAQAMPQTPSAPGAPAAPSAAAPTASAAPGASSAHIPGVPLSLSSGMPVGPQLEAQARTIENMQQEREKLNTLLTQQSYTAVPIFEVATNLYKAGSNPALAGAFGVFEKGDPLSIIGKALESGSFPSVIANMRQYITQARLGQDEKKRALSDLQAMEGALADLQTKMQNGVINPTDVRTMFESESIPGVRNTQDAFLRGVARIGSDALTRYETKAAFDQALQDPKFNILNWGSSNYFRDVQENAKKRTQSLITNPATTNMPRFMQQGLSGAYQVQPRPTAGAAQGTTVPRSTDWQEEARRRGLIQ